MSKKLQYAFRRVRVRTGVLLASSLLLGSAGGLLAQRPWPLWQAYTEHFLDAQGRVIDHAANDRTTSEGESYAMFFALVANDRPRFEALLRWTTANLAGGDLAQHLPGWAWGRTSSGAWGPIDLNSAADADLWMAYDLIEAGRLWHDAEFNRLGRALAAQIAREETVSIPGMGTWLASGARGFQPVAGSYVLNPSYMPLPLLARCAGLFPQGPWRSMLRSAPRLTAPQVGSGYAMDWVVASAAGVQAAAGPTGTGGAPVGSYDAIRVYLWVGMTDPHTPGQRVMLNELKGMAKALAHSAAPPLGVLADGGVVPGAAPPGFSAALVPYLVAEGASAAAKAQQDRVESFRDGQTGLLGRPSVYYDQNLALFSQGRTEGRYRMNESGLLQVSW